MHSGSCSQMTALFSKETQSRTLVFTNSHQFESTKSLYKFPLEASNLYLLWDFVEFNFFQVELHMRSLQLEK